MTQKPLAVALTLAVAAATSACVTMAGVAQTRAANDLRCPQDQIVVTNIGGSSFRATGCGQEATYNCVQSSQSTLACVREEQRPATTTTTGAAR
jgi:hypothetical protein